MLQIKETYPGDNLVRIQIYGILDHQSIRTLQEVFKRHLIQNRRVTLDLEGLTHISREARDFLEKVQNTITIINPPKFVRLGDS